MLPLAPKPWTFNSLLHIGKEKIEQSKNRKSILITV